MALPPSLPRNAVTPFSLATSATYNFDPGVGELTLYAFQMAGYASQYNHFITARTGSGSERTFTQIESFARLVHESLNPTEVAYHVANEGRKLIECDRLCVGVRHARHKVTVEAVSGADVVEIRRPGAPFEFLLAKRRDQVRRLISISYQIVRRRTKVVNGATGSK